MKSTTFFIATLALLALLVGAGPLAAQDAAEHYTSSAPSLLKHRDFGIPEAQNVGDLSRTESAFTRSWCGRLRGRGATA